MNHNHWIANQIVRFFAFVLMLSLLLSACGTGAKPTQEVVEPVDEELSSVVSATGIVVPQKFASLSLKAAGVIGEVLVSEGDTVQAGQTLVILTGGDPNDLSPEYRAGISARELEVEAAQQALDNLDDQAEALRLQAEQMLNSAAGQIRDLQYRLEALNLPDSQETLTPIEGYDTALQAYQDALAAFEPYRDEPEDDNDRQELEDNLDDARDEYDTAVERLQLSLTLEVAEANWDQARSDWEKYKNGPASEDVLLAKRRLESAKTALEAARSAVDSLTLVAPFSGTVSDVLVKAGEYGTPGQPAVVLADLSGLYIETTDLNEIDMIQIATGDPVQITFDALPDVTVDGKVVSIAGRASPGAGVNYRVGILMNTRPDGLKWGMSAFVDILPQE